jgi:hypothetical protein
VLNPNSVGAEMNDEFDPETLSFELKDRTTGVDMLWSKSDMSLFNYLKKLFSYIN